MSQEVEVILGDLGMSQYLPVFFDQGFDTWETILDITESDLDALGVKLGHRRKLQRRIANARGIAPDTVLGSWGRTSSDDSKTDPRRFDAAVRVDVQPDAVATKRKYRRHPKPDENAPERPPSAYVLFSNKMREDLKVQSLSFTEIAKRVGENWQNLSFVEKVPFETQAQLAKDKFNRELAAYKKTPEYRKYSQYLQDFKRIQASKTQLKAEQKRPKLELTRSHHGSTSSGATTSCSNEASASGSGSDSPPISEPPPKRQQRDGQSAPADEPLMSPASAHRGSTSSQSSREPGKRRRHSTNSSRHDHRKRTHLPSLSHVLDEPAFAHSISRSPEGRSFSASSFQPYQDLGGPENGLSLEAKRIPPLRHESSSNGSSCSRNATYYHASMAKEASLPIHALLSNGNGPSRQPWPTSATEASPVQVDYLPPPLSSYRSASHQVDDDSPLAARSSLAKPTVGRRIIDPMSVLLKAGEMVERSSARPILDKDPRATTNTPS